MRCLPGGRDHDLNNFPSDASASVLQPAQQPAEARFPRHEARLRVPEQLFVVLSDDVGHHDGRDFGAHGSVLSRGGSGGDGKSLGLCGQVVRDRGWRCVVVAEAVLNGIDLVAMR